jgi:hypothetical protein
LRQFPPNNEIEKEGGTGIEIDYENSDGAWKEYSARRLADE